MFEVLKAILQMKLRSSVLYGGSVDRCRLEGHPEAHSGEMFDIVVNSSQQSHDTVSDFLRCIPSVLV